MNNKNTRKTTIKFRVNEQELKIIEKRATLTNEKSLSSYLRKMALSGMIVNVNFTEFADLKKELTAIGANVNQIARRINSTNRFYARRCFFKTNMRLKINFFVKLSFFIGFFILNAL